MVSTLVWKASSLAAELLVAKSMHDLLTQQHGQLQGSHVYVEKPQGMHMLDKLVYTSVSDGRHTWQSAPLMLCAHSTPLLFEMFMWISYLTLFHVCEGFVLRYQLVAATAILP